MWYMSIIGIYRYMKQIFGRLSIVRKCRLYLVLYEVKAEQIVVLSKVVVG